MVDTPKLKIFSGLGGFSVIAVADMNKFTEEQLAEEVKRIEQLTGKRLGVTSNAGLTGNRLRLTFLP